MDAPAGVGSLAQHVPLGRLFGAGGLSQRRFLSHAVPANDDRPISHREAFDQRAIREMSLAFESVCNALGVTDDDDAGRKNR
jgi:hypothetical protein